MYSYFVRVVDNKLVTAFVCSNAFKFRFWHS